METRGEDTHPHDPAGSPPASTSHATRGAVGGALRLLSRSVFVMVITRWLLSVGKPADVSVRPAIESGRVHLRCVDDLPAVARPHCSHLLRMREVCVKCVMFRSVRDAAPPTTVRAREEVGASRCRASAMVEGRRMVYCAYELDVETEAKNSLSSAELPHRVPALGLLPPRCLPILPNPFVPSRAACKLPARSWSTVKSRRWRLEVGRDGEDAEGRRVE